MEKKRFNAVDAIIVIFIAIVIAGCGFIVKMFLSEGTGDMKTVVVEVTEQKKSFCDIISTGDMAYDGVENVQLGKVTAFEVKPCEVSSLASETGEIIKTPIPDRYDILLTIEAPKDAELPVGKQLWVETSLYKCSGFILEVNDGGKADMENEDN